ncbi:MAG: MSHA pilin protein MshB [Phenylobacterium sp.]|jgi:MSHA pilin protein MshB
MNNAKTQRGQTRQRGFTLIELIAVVVILGFLSATAIPKFMNATDDAKEAAVEGVAGGIASAVGLVRAQWELEGRTLTVNLGSSGANNAGTVLFDNTTIWVNAIGYPFTAGTATPTSTVPTQANCELTFDNILQNSPSSTIINSAITNRYYVSTATINSLNSCVYHLMASLDRSSGSVGSPTISNGEGFYYTPDSGRIIVFNN